MLTRTGITSGLFVMLSLYGGRAYAEGPPKAAIPVAAPPKVALPAPAAPPAPPAASARAPSGKLALDPQRLLAVERAFRGTDSAELHRIATGDHVTMTEARFGADRPQRPTHAEALVWDRVGRDLSTKLTLLAPPNRNAILEVGRRGDPASVSFLSSIALGEIAVKEGGAVIQPVSLSRGAINSPRDAAIVALGMIGGRRGDHDAWKAPRDRALVPTHARLTRGDR